MVFLKYKQTTVQGPHPLLVGVKTGANTLESNMRFLQKTWTQTTI